MQTDGNSPAGYKSTPFGEAESLIRKIMGQRPAHHEMDRSERSISRDGLRRADASGTLVCITQPDGPPLPGITAAANGCKGTLVVYSKIS
jgi:hypothetical protein